MPAPTIFFSFAHPDDESFLVAGVASRYAAAGVKLVLSTATLGESGKCGDPPICRREELPLVREREWHEAAALLGIDDRHLLGYRDRALAEAPADEIRQKLVVLIRSRRPDVVISFDPDGSNRHPDHVAISRFTSDAIAAAADPRWFPDAGSPHHVRRLLWTPRLPPWDLSRRADLAQEASVDVLVDIRPWRNRKIDALRAHRTQHLSIDRIFFHPPDADRLFDFEIFRQAWGPPLERRPVDDLLAGL